MNIEIEKKINDSFELPNNVVECVASPLVTVRTSTYQHKDYIKECIEGILKQKTNFQFEYIIILSKYIHCTRTFQVISSRIIFKSICST